MRGENKYYNIHLWTIWELKYQYNGKNFEEEQEIGYPILVYSIFVF